MARKLVSQQDVYAAAEEMLQAGKKPSTIGIHRILGRGSYTTIGQYLKQWEEEVGSLGQIVETPAEEPVPSSISKDAELFIRKLWVMACKHEHDQLEKERAALNRRELEIQEEAQKVVDASNKMQERVEKLEEELQNKNALHEKELNARIQAERSAAISEAALNRTQNDLASLEEKLSAANTKYETKLEEVATLNSTVSRLNEDISRLNRDLEQEKEQLESLRQKQANTDASLNEEKSKNKRLQEQLHQLQKKEQEQRSELNDVNAEKLRLASENANLLGRLEECSRQIIQLENRLQQSIETIEALKAAQQFSEETKESDNTDNKQE